MKYTLMCYNLKAYSDDSFGVQNEILQDNSKISIWSGYMDDDEERRISSAYF
jgi:hypothetical protein